MKRRLTHPLLRSAQRLRAAFWRRRVFHWLIRAAWLALLVPIAVIGGYYWQGWEIRPQNLFLAMLAVILAVILWAMRPLRLKKMAQRLDNRLGLRNRFVTALEVVETPAVKESEHSDGQNPVAERLMLETVQTITRLRTQVHLFNQTFWLETRTLIGVVALLSALIILNTLRPRIPEVGPIDLPPAWQEPTAEDVLSPDIELGPPPPQPVAQPPQAMSDAQVQAALEALADALRDQSTTRAVADALDQGDVSGAAEQLRRLADQLDQLAPETQVEIGESLQQAADNIGPEAPALTDPLETGSRALNRGDLLEAGEALEQVAEALDSLGAPPPEVAENEGEPAEDSASDDSSTESQPGENEGESQESDETDPVDEQEGENSEGNDESGAGEGAGEDEGEGDAPEQPTEAERLAAEGEPLELESELEELDDRVLQPAELDAEVGDAITQDSPFARRPVNVTGDLGPDLLTYPWEKREIIRTYFTPP